MTRYADLPPSERPSDEPCQLCGHAEIHHTTNEPNPFAVRAPCDYPDEWRYGPGTCCEAYPECGCPKCGCATFVSSYEVEEAEIVS